MKQSLRILSILLSVVLLLGSLTACLEGSKPSGSEQTTVVPGVVTTAPDATTADPSLEQTTASGGEQTPVATTTASKLPPKAPTSLLEKYPYVLTQEDYDSYLAVLATCEELTLVGTDTEAIEKAWEELDELYYYIATQSQIAYVQYCVNLNNSDYEESYLFSSELSTDSYSEYVKVCQKIYNSESPYKDEFFSDWTEDEIESMLATTDEMAECAKINDEILAEYYALSPLVFDEQTCLLFMEMVENNNRLADLHGYDNYIEYAYAEIYNRDYEPEKVEEMRELVKEYIIPMFDANYQTLWELYNKLSPTQQKQFDKILYGSYNQMDYSALEAYMESLVESSGTAMHSMFDDGNLIVVDSDKAREGAFTGYYYDYETPICYFGPGYQSIFTVAHELGHYYAFVDNGSVDLQMDFAELQSQGNEFMMLAFLENANQTRVWKTVAANQLYSTLISIVVCCMVDEFEQYVYTHEITDPTTELDKIMNDIVQSYANGRFKSFVDMNQYWRAVVIESPVYYISYAVSGVMALDLYSVAKQDYTAATEQYRALVEDVTGEDTLQDFLQIAGLGSPFDEETYKRIATAIES